MSAQVTEAHVLLANQLVSSPPSPLVLATLIADSEAKATAQLRADRDYNHECINRLASATGTLGEKSGRVVEVALSTIARAERAEAELAAERARLDWLLSRMSGNVLPVNQCVAWTVDVYHYGNRFPSRAAIDAAVEEEKP